MTAKNLFRSSTTSIGGRLLTILVEPTTSTKTTATWRSSPAEPGPPEFGGGGDLTPDVTAEQIAQLFALAQACHHRVEPALQLAEFGAVEHHHAGFEVARLDSLLRRPHHPHRGGGEPRQDPHQQEADGQAGRRDDQHGEGGVGAG